MLLIIIIGAIYYYYYFQPRADSMICHHDTFTAFRLH